MWGGVVPDLILRDNDGNPVRIIEVVVTSSPSKDKRQKLDRLEKRGVDVVEVVVTEQRDLLGLCWTPSRISFYAGSVDQQADRAIMELAENLSRCSPEVRRRFVEVCQAMTSIESIQPLHPDNPLIDHLRKGDG